MENRICSTCNKSLTPLIPVNLEAQCLCFPEKIYDIVIPKEPKVNGEYTVRMLAALFKELFYKGRIEEYKELYRLMKVIYLNIDFGKGIQVPINVKELGIEEVKNSRDI